MTTNEAARGLDTLKARSLIETIWKRRTHRVSRGSDVTAGDISYKSAHRRAPPLAARRSFTGRNHGLHRTHHA